MQNPINKKTTRATASLPLLRREQGSVLLVIIIVLIICSALGAAMLPLTTTANRSMVHTNLYQTAHYLAESGYRYAASKFLHAGDGLSGTASADARDTMITTLDAAPPFQVDTNSSFELYITAYYFNSVSVSGSNLVTNIYGSPPPITSQAGYLLIGDTNYKNHYNSITVTGNTVQFNTIADWTNPASPVALSSTPGNERVFPACKSDGTALTNASVACAADTGIGIFPPKNGSFKINNTGHVYSYRKLDSASNQLQGISSPSGGPLPVTLTANDFLVMQRCITLTSTGSIGSAADPVTHGITYYLANVSTGASSGGSGPTEAAPPVDINLDAPNGSPLPDTLDTKTGSGWGNFEIADNALHVTNIAGNAKGSTVGIDVDFFEDAWLAENKFLSYDIQAKMKVAHDPNVAFSEDDFYLTGICVRLNTLGTGTMKYIGVSFIKTNDESGSHKDNIHDNLYLSDYPMIMIWKEEHGNNAELPLAYFILDNPAGQHVVDAKGYLKDWSTLVVRVEEKIAPAGTTFAGQRVNDIRVYYADTDAHGTSNDVPDDDFRKAYQRNQNPRLWPVDDIGDWTADTDNSTLVKWDGVANGAALLATLDNENGAIVRIADDAGHTFNTVWDPNVWPTGRPEAGLHAFGNTITNFYFEDVAVRFPSSGSGVGVMTPGFQTPIQE